MSKSITRSISAVKVPINVKVWLLGENSFHTFIHLKYAFWSSAWIMQSLFIAYGERCVYRTAIHGILKSIAHASCN